MEHTEYHHKIFDFYERHHRMPSYAEIMKLVGFRSKNAVAKLVHRMVEAGLIAKDSQGRLIPTRMSTELPLVGVVEAGVPSVAEEHLLETINIEQYLLPHKEKTFLLEVKGDSMIEAHIEEGDVVIAERAEDAKDGEIVVAEVDGEWTLKFLRKNTKTKKVWLEPANKKYAPIHPADSLRIAAVVRGVIRKY